MPKKVVQYKLTIYLEETILDRGEYVQKTRCLVDEFGNTRQELLDKITGKGNDLFNMVPIQRTEPC